MGVPHFFKYLIENYPDILLKGFKLPRVDHLFFDLNCLIHPCASAAIKIYDSKTPEERICINIENLIIKETKKYLDTLINYADPQKTIYIAIDGPAPRAKMQQQRQRRFKTARMNREITRFKKSINLNTEIWDKNAITPGTEFMNKINNEMRKYLKTLNKKTKNLILSDSNVPGEGEHKILDYIKKEKKGKIEPNDIVVIYGLDADLIFLAMITDLENIFLLRERIYFKNPRNIEKNDENILDYLSIHLLKKYFMSDTKLKTGIDYIEGNLINDFIFLCFLIGNDFLPTIPSISIKQGGLNELNNIYLECFKDNDKHLITSKGINEKFLLTLFKKLANTEEDLFKKQYLKRKYKNFNISFIPDPKKTPEENTLNENIFNLEIVYNQERDTIQLGRQGYRERYYSYYWGLNKNNKQEYEDKIKEICEKYIDGLVWNHQYYFKTIHDYKWYYPYMKAPLPQDIYNYLSNIKLSEINFSRTEPPKPIVQLLMVLPSDSYKLLPSKVSHLLVSSTSDLIEYYPSDFEVDKINHIYYSECVPYLPNIDYEYLLSVYNQNKLSSKDNSNLNTFHKEELIKSTI